MSKEGIVITVITLLVVLGVVFVIIKMPAAPKPQNTTVATSDMGYLANSKSHMTGKLGAKVTVVEFGDYQCPGCGAANPTTMDLIKTYGTNPNFNFVFRNFPLDIHPNAPIAAEASEAAGAQGKYWEMHDMIYAKQNEWAENTSPLDIFVGYAKTLGLDTEKFKADVSTNKYSDFINADRADGDKIGVNFTPSFYINGELQMQIPNDTEFKAKIDAMLK